VIPVERKLSRSSSGVGWDCCSGCLLRWMGGGGGGCCGWLYIVDETCCCCWVVIIVGVGFT